MCKRLSCRRYNAGRVFAYDGWDLVREWRTDGAGATNVLDYYWGLDLSGTLGGAGGIGGLLAVSVGGDFYLPLYDANGNVTAYIDESGNTVAQYTYDVRPEQRPEFAEVIGAGKTVVLKRTTSVTRDFREAEDTRKDLFSAYYHREITDRDCDVPAYFDVLPKGTVLRYWGIMTPV